MPDNAITGVALSREYLEMKFERDPKLREEFQSADAYVAYAQAEAAGKVRIIANRIVHGPRPSK